MAGIFQLVGRETREPKVAYIPRKADAGHLSIPASGAAQYAGDCHLPHSLWVDQAVPNEILPDVALHVPICRLQIAVGSDGLPVTPDRTSVSSGATGKAELRYYCPFALPCHGDISQRPAVDVSKINGQRLPVGGVVAGCDKFSFVPAVEKLSHRA